MNFWKDHCEPPRPKADGLEWDVFISYRSLDRVWTIALYDMLTECGYKVFMDQFVLVPGQGLASQLGRNLEKSASGVLIWSERTVDSGWVENEYNAMFAHKTDSAASENPFYFVVTTLDGQKPPGLSGGQLYLDFSEYPDGPMGADLVRLTYGLQGKPLSEPAVRQVVEWESSAKEEPANLRAMAKTGFYDRILTSIKSDEIAYTTSPTMSGVAVDLLIRGKQYELALEALEFSLARFPRSVRLRQLKGLALRRHGQTDEAAFELTVLLEKGHRDTETLGILAAVYADKWEQLSASGDHAGARDALEKSRNLYEEGFSKVPTDTYTGINAASKSALLGETDKAVELAEKVLGRLNELEQARGGGPSEDYWERVTEPEALLVKGEFEKALELYHAARVAHQHETGSIESTGDQVERLLGVLDIPGHIKNALKAEFDL